MKFMQRAKSSPSTPDQHPAKRKKQHGDSPTPFEANALVGQPAIQAAVEEEERLKEAALKRAAELAGDSHWVLPVCPIQAAKEATLAQRNRRVVYVGYAEIDQPYSHIPGTDTEFATQTQLGRRTYGKVEKPTESSESESESEDDPESEGEYTEEDPMGANAMMRAARTQAAEQAKAERKKKKKADKAESVRLAAAREKKTVRLNTLTSISGSSTPMDAVSRKRKGNEDSKRPHKQRK